MFAICWSGHREGRGTTLGRAIIGVKKSTGTWLQPESRVAARERGDHGMSEGERRFRDLADSVDGMFFTCNLDGTCTFVSRGIVELVGFSRERFMERGYYDAVAEEDRERVGRCWEIAARTHVPFSYDVGLYTPDGSVRQCHIKVRLGRDGRGEGAQWVGTVTERDELLGTDDVLTAIRQRRDLRDVVPIEIAENVRDILWLLDWPTLRTRYLNKAYEDIFGRSRAEIDGKIEDWVARVHPADRERFVAAAAARTGGAFDEEYRIVRPDGGVRWVRNKASPVRDASGNVTHIFGVCEDITERRELESQLRATQKMESIGQLAGGIAHDFNNLLTIIVACNEELLEELRDVPALREPLLETRLAVQRATSLTRDLLAFSRRRHHDPKVVDLNEVVSEAERMLRRLLGEDVAFSTGLAPRLPCVRIDAAQFTSVLVNFAVNARHAMPKGGVLALATYELEAGAPPPAMDPHFTAHIGVRLPPARHVVLEITDTGAGFDRAVADRIFEPFFTTKTAGKGTGLGLAVVHGIVKQCGGHIEVASALGVGTTFRVFLPAAGHASPSTRDAVTPDLRGTETVLLVEDESAVRRAASRGLEARGFRVLGAGDAEEALRILEGRRGEIDILVTDVVLPKMDGRSLVERVTERFPNVKVLYTSGYANDDVSRYGLSLADVAFIEKPYTPHRLVRKMRQVLDEAPATARSKREAG